MYGKVSNVSKVWKTFIVLKRCFVKPNLPLPSRKEYRSMVQVRILQGL